MTDASRKPSRRWPFIARELKRENDSELILKLVAELNRAMAAHGTERARVLRFLERKSTQEWPLRIDVHDLSLRTCCGDDDVNLDLQPQPKRSRAGNQSSMAIDSNGFAITGQRFTDA